jgi:hypothetical protein
MQSASIFCSGETVVDITQPQPQPVPVPVPVLVQEGAGDNALGLEPDTTVLEPGPFKRTGGEVSEAVAATTQAVEDQNTRANTITDLDADAVSDADENAVSGAGAAAVLDPDAVSDEGADADSNRGADAISAADDDYGEVTGGNIAAGDEGPVVDGDYSADGMERSGEGGDDDDGDDGDADGADGDNDGDVDGGYGGSGSDFSSADTSRELGPPQCPKNHGLTGNRHY